MILPKDSIQFSSALIFTRVRRLVGGPEKKGAQQRWRGVDEVDSDGRPGAREVSGSAGT